MNAIRAIRERYGLSQADLARALGMSRRAVQGHELADELPRRIALAVRGLEVEMSNGVKTTEDKPCP